MLATLLVFAIASCDGSSGVKQAEDDLSKSLGTIKSLNMEMIDEVMETGVRAMPDAGAQLAQLESLGIDIDKVFQIVIAYFSRFDYKVRSSKMDGSFAVVTVDITSIDATSLVTKLVSKFTQFSGMLNQGQPEPEAIATILDELVVIFTDSSLKAKTTKCDFRMKLVDGVYIPILDEGNINALTGGAVSYARVAGMGGQLDEIFQMLENYQIQMYEQSE